MKNRFFFSYLLFMTALLPAAQNQKVDRLKEIVHGELRRGQTELALINARKILHKNPKTAVNFLRDQLISEEQLLDELLIKIYQSDYPIEFEQYKTDCLSNSSLCLNKTLTYAKFSLKDAAKLEALLFQRKTALKTRGKLLIVLMQVLDEPRKRLLAARLENKIGHLLSCSPVTDGCNDALSIEILQRYLFQIIKTYGRWTQSIELQCKRAVQRTDLLFICKKKPNSNK